MRYQTRQPVYVGCDDAVLQTDVQTVRLFNDPWGFRKRDESQVAQAPGYEYPSYLYLSQSQSALRTRHRQPVSSDLC